MKLTRAPRRTPPETIITLIDVVFFLLVFFMLIGRMDATAPFDVVPPVAITGTDMPAGGATLSVSATGDLALDGVGLAQLDLGPALDRLLQQDAGLRLRVNAHRLAELRHVLPLVAQAEALGFHDVVLVVTPADPP